MNNIKYFKLTKPFALSSLSHLGAPNLVRKKGFPLFE